MTSLRIIGAGGHGKVVADTAEALEYEGISFLDHDWPGRDTNGRWRIVGQPSELGGQRFCAIGDNAVRARMFETLDLYDSPVLAHPSSMVSTSAQLGAGTFLAAGVVVNADARLGCGVILNTGCSVDHDCILGDFVHVSPGARLAGNVEIGANSWIGIGAVVREGVRIGRDVIVGAGAAVVEDVDDGVRVGGVPAKRI
ncbi:acetyltransferase [Sulfitobacter geojensis]|uniref:Acetyltransferase n=1 Tax=Sulfitobacter geojensis TaxID=1342299 RepID=A0AAE3B5R3_9RHOB|nr:acetyltransferase [Sulfitobacter geojensis]MBM1689161.1 acetyltransferase [Sulfitobacter geojensis]MBM1693228.1 acetyltransferase [Sulfitobacter geojensis]MBM1705394.1 acetyltransferase [Sulfitobacter geojensis]MBM1709452.1 acetyltransferase [Sulfitobacter geojensis]MBM1713517.1 acetyltransferase [Sulfitobacter geojensis]